MAFMQAEPDTDPVLAEVEKFLEAADMTPTAFGQKALNDPTLVHEMRRGRECKRATRTRILEFIAAESAARQSAQRSAA